VEDGGSHLEGRLVRLHLLIGHTDLEGSAWSIAGDGGSMYLEK